MSTLTELRDYVHAQTDTTTTDLPNATVDNYLQEAFNRTINAETQWPFLEKTWTGTQTAGNAYFAMPSDCEELVSVVDSSNNNFRMTQIDLNEAEDQYFRAVATSGYPAEYAIWNDIVYLFPQITYDANHEYSVRGYRTTIDWLAGVPTVTEPDCDSRLHLPLAHYAIALAYAQQEDEQLESVYMERWQRDVELARKKIMDPRHNRPLIMGPNRITRIGHGRYRPSFAFDLP